LPGVTLPGIPRNPVAQTCDTHGSVLGIDVSGWRKTISWEAIKNAGIEFGFI
jgi:GH25 family lysozyme M1 (1,4-beta-N-acetylmuramidase)